MKKMVCHIQPFLSAQTIHNIIDNNEVGSWTSATEHLAENLLQYGRDNEFYEITLAGSQIYNKSVKHKIENQELTEYNENKIKITLF